MIALLNALFGVHEDADMPDDLKLGNLDRLDGITTRRPVAMEVAA